MFRDSDLFATTIDFTVTIEPSGHTVLECRFPDTPPQKKIVFLQGVCSSIRRDAAYPFTTLRARLVSERGFSSSDLLDYSYQGGQVKNGNWVPKPYQLNIPVKTDYETKAVTMLHDSLMLKYRLAKPNTTFVLVGHSLGGMVAMQEVVRKASTPTFSRGLVSRVVTINSPLHGVDKDVKTAGWAADQVSNNKKCITGGAAADKLVQLHDQEPQTTSVLQSSIDAASANFVRVLNVGNSYDCVFAPILCNALAPTGDAQTQWVAGSNANLYFGFYSYPCGSSGLNLRECTTRSHLAVLTEADAAAARTRILEFIGDQKQSY
ncbi:MAG: hypothetical protein IT307_07810 [Chloroflexi bacterium]|nr:hypothetical protein [Chloroflexota bacterium]